MSHLNALFATLRLRWTDPLWPSSARSDRCETLFTCCHHTQKARGILHWKQACRCSSKHSIRGAGNLCDDFRQPQPGHHFGRTENNPLSPDRCDRPLSLVLSCARTFQARTSIPSRAYFSPARSTLAIIAPSSLSQLLKALFCFRACNQANRDVSEGRLCICLPLPRCTARWKMTRRGPMDHLI